MKKQRILSILLALCMLTSVLTFASAKSAESYTDVPKDCWYYQYVDTVTQRGYFRGVTHTEFAPGADMTRSMFVVVLSRVANATVDNSVSSFSDVPAGLWYSGAVKWAADNGIVNGYTKNGVKVFDPDASITRDQLCVMLDRFITWYGEQTNQVHRESGSTEPFPDAGTFSNYAKEAIANCRRYGLVNGYADGKFHPTDTTSRAEVAKIVVRLSWKSKTSGGGVIPSVTYTVNYWNGAAKVDSATVDAGDNFTTLSALTEAGKVFVGWNDKADGTGTAYAADTEYAISADLDLYAQWLDDNDYIGLAVKASMDSLNAYQSTVNHSKWGATTEMEPLVFNSAIVSGARTQDVTFKAEVSDDVVIAIVQKASSMAIQFLGDSADRADLKTEVSGYVDEIVNKVRTELGIDLESATVQQLKDAVYAYLRTEGADLWANFRETSSGKYYTGNVTVTAGSAQATVLVNEAAGTTTLQVPAGQTKRQLVARLAVAMARDMYEDLKANTAYTSQVEMTAAVTFRFSAPANEFAPVTDTHPYVYPVNVTLKLDGGDLAEYKFEGGRSYVKLNVTEDIQTTYETELQRAVEAALNNDKVKSELASRIDSSLVTLKTNATFSAMVTAMEKVGMGTAAANAKLDAVLNAWVAANMDVNDLVNSNLFKLYWLGDTSAAFDNSELYGLVDFIAETAANVVREKFIEGLTSVGATPALARERADNYFLDASYTPTTLVEDMTAYGIDLGALDTNPALAPIKDYLLAKVCDAVRADAYDDYTAFLAENPGKTPASNYTNYTAYDYAAAERADLESAIDAKLEEAVSTSTYYGYLQKALKLQKFEDLKDVQLGNLATLLTNSTFQNAVTGYGNGMVKRVTKIFSKVPADASVTVNGILLDDVAVAKLRSNSTKEACDNLAALLNTTGLSTLTLNAFAPEAGVPVTVTYGARNFTFNLVIDVK